ncbi:MAG: hypothetical protein OEY59_00980 [Deltaproteobacteria bacterium]|nr:hypothetical protein [Deltaproteobacteria bacterium]
MRTDKTEGLGKSLIGLTNVVDETRKKLNLLKEGIGELNRSFKKPMKDAGATRLQNLNRLSDVSINSKSTLQGVATIRQSQSDQGPKIDQKGINEVIQKSGDNFGSLVNQAGEMFAQSGLGMVLAINQSIESIIKMPMSILDSFTSLFDEINNFPENLDKSVEGFLNGLEKLPESLPKIIDALVEAIPKVVDALIKAMPQVALALVNATARLVSGTLTSAANGISNTINAVISGKVFRPSGRGGSGDYMGGELNRIKEEFDQFLKTLSENNRTLEVKLSDYRKGASRLIDLYQQREDLTLKYESQDFNAVDENGDKAPPELSHMEYIRQLRELEVELVKISESSQEFRKEVLKSAMEAANRYNVTLNEQKRLLSQWGKSDEELLELVSQKIEGLNERYDLKDPVEKQIARREYFELKKEELELQTKIIKARKQELDQLKAKKDLLKDDLRETILKGVDLIGDKKDTLSQLDKVQDKIRRVTVNIENTSQRDIKRHNRLSEELIDLRKREIEFTKEVLDQKQFEIDQAKGFHSELVDYQKSVERSGWESDQWEEEVGRLKNEINSLDYSKPDYGQDFMGLNRQIFSALKQLSEKLEKVAEQFSEISSEIGVYLDQRDQGHKQFIDYKRSFEDLNGSRVLGKPTQDETDLEQATSLINRQFSNVKNLVAIHDKTADDLFRLKEGLQNWQTSRKTKDWGLSEWQVRFDELEKKSSSFLPSGDPKESLKLQQGMYDALIQVTQQNETQIAQTKAMLGVLKGAFEKTQMSIQQILGGELNPSENFAFQQNRVEELYQKTLHGTTEERVSAIEDFAGLIPGFLDEAKKRYRSSNTYQELFDLSLARLRESEAYLSDNINLANLKFDELGSQDFSELIERFSNSLDQSILREEIQSQNLVQYLEGLDQTAQFYQGVAQKNIQDIQSEINYVSSSLEKFISNLESILKVFINDYRKSLGLPLQAATGGVFEGPSTGYPMILHNTEAVVPLPDGRSIPVKGMGLNGGELKETNQLLRRLLESQNKEIKVEVDGGRLDSRIRLVSDEMRVEAENRQVGGRPMFL